MAMTRVMALELGEHGIRVNTLSPGLTMSDTLMAENPGHIATARDRVAGFALAQARPAPAGPARRAGLPRQRRERLHDRAERPGRRRQFQHLIRPRRHGSHAAVALRRYFRNSAGFRYIHPKYPTFAGGRHGGRDRERRRQAASPTANTTSTRCGRIITPASPSIGMTPLWKVMGALVPRRAGDPMRARGLAFRRREVAGHGSGRADQRRGSQAPRADPAKTRHCAASRASPIRCSPASR